MVYENVRKKNVQCQLSGWMVATESPVVGVILVCALNVILIKCSPSPITPTAINTFRMCMGDISDSKLNYIYLNIMELTSEEEN